MPGPTEVVATQTGPFIAAFSGGSFLALLALVVKQIGPWRKQTTDATDKLIAQLTERLDKVEKARELDRRIHYIQVARLEARHQAQRSLDRHKFVNSDANLDSLLRILELSPEKAPEAARQAREARAKQRTDEQIEAAMIHKAEMEAVERAERELEENDSK